MMRMSKKMVVLGQTVRLLPIIGEPDKEATYPSLVRLHSHIMIMMMTMMVMMMRRRMARRRRNCQVKFN